MNDPDLAAPRAWETFAGVRQPEEIASLEGWDPDVEYVADVGADADGRVVWFRAYLDPAEALGEAEG
jgi:hypothetical protein